MIPKFETNQALILTTDFSQSLPESTVALVDVDRPSKKPAFVFTTKETVVGLHALKNKILLVLRSRVLAFQVNEKYKEYLIDTGKMAVASAMAPFPGKVDKYGLVVVNQVDSKGKCVVDVHNFVDGEYLMHQRFSLEEDAQPTGQLTTTLFSAERDRLFLYQEDKKVLWVYQWTDNAKLAHLGNVPLLSGLTDVAKFPPVQRVYHLWGAVFLFFFQNGHFKLIDCEVSLKKMMVLKTFLQFDLPNWSGSAQGELDPFSFPQVFVSYKKSGMNKPTELTLDIYHVNGDLYQVVYLVPQQDCKTTWKGKWLKEGIAPEGDQIILL